MKKARFRWLLILVMVIGVGLVLEDSAQADYVDELVKTLNTHKSYKVRLTAVLGLSKYEDPRAMHALLKTLKRRRERSVVRGFAAIGLANMKALPAIPSIRKASRSRNRYLRKKAREAMRSLCPRRVRGKSFYVNFSKSRSKGPFHRYALTQVKLLVAKNLSKNRKDIVLGWPRCRRPSYRALRRKRIRGYYVRINLKISESNGMTTCSMDMLFSSYPQNSLRGMSSEVRVSIPTRPDRAIVTRLIGVLVKNSMSSLNRFLN